MQQPLGEYKPFKMWSGRPRTWGPDDQSRVWFGGQVLDGLAEVIDEHVAAVMSQREPMPAAIGCVPWLTCSGIAERLARLHACCIVVDKGHNRLASALAAADNVFPNVLPGLRGLLPLGPDGKVPIIGPCGRMDYAVGPVRAVGMAGEKWKPLLHAKLLVLGRLVWVEIGPDGGPTEEVLTFESESVWWGSANWTDGSRAHLEMGACTTDPHLVQEATAFLDDLIAFSEPLLSVARTPQPDLVSPEWDEHAMIEAMRDPDDDPDDDFD